MCSYILQTVMDKYFIKRLKKKTSEQSSIGDKPINNETPSLSIEVSIETNPLFVR